MEDSIIDINLLNYIYESLNNNCTYYDFLTKTQYYKNLEDNKYIKQLTLTIYLYIMNYYQS
jgi:hypothetical protein